MSLRCFRSASLGSVSRYVLRDSGAEIKLVIPRTLKRNLAYKSALDPKFQLLSDTTCRNVLLLLLVLLVLSLLVASLTVGNQGGSVLRALANSPNYEVQAWSGSQCVLTSRFVH